MDEFDLPLPPILDDDFVDGRTWSGLLHLFVCNQKLWMERAILHLFFWVVSCVGYTHIHIGEQQGLICVLELLCHAQMNNQSAGEKISSMYICIQCKRHTVV